MPKKSAKTVSKKKSAPKAAKKAAPRQPPKKPKKKAAQKVKTKVEITIKRKILGQAPEEFHFVLNDGKKLKDVFELVDALGEMHEDIFRHHVTEMRNDFSNWIQDVFDEESLAEQIRKVEDRFETERKLMRHLIQELKKAVKI